MSHHSTSSHEQLQELLNFSFPQPQDTDETASFRVFTRAEMLQLTQILDDCSTSGEGRKNPEMPGAEPELVTEKGGTKRLCDSYKLLDVAVAVCAVVVDLRLQVDVTHI